MLEPAGATDVIEAPNVTDVTDETGARADFDARFATARERLLRITASWSGRRTRRTWCRTRIC